MAKLDLKSYKWQVHTRLHHQAYSANSWLLRPGLSENKTYLAAPTITGSIVIFNLDSGRVTAILKAHEESEVRQICFHPTLPFLGSCGDDGQVRLYFGK